MKKVILFLTLCFQLLLSNPYTLYESNNGFNDFYVKVDGFSKELELFIGTAEPSVIQLESLSENIKLLHCSGGIVGSSHMMDYRYTYILDFKNQRVIDIFETYLDYDVDKNIKKSLEPIWSLKNNIIEVSYFEDGFYSPNTQRVIKKFAIDERDNFIYFPKDSMILSEEMKKKVLTFINKNQTIQSSLITLRSYPSKESRYEYAHNLAYLRASKMRELLVSYGIDPKNLKIVVLDESIKNLYPFVEIDID